MQHCTDPIIRDCAERLAKLEERVFVNQSERFEQQKEEIAGLSRELQALNSRLNLLILVLVGNFGVTLFKAVPLLAKIL